MFTKASSRWLDKPLILLELTQVHIEILTRARLEPWPPDFQAISLDRENSGPKVSYGLSEETSFQRQRFGNKSVSSIPATQKNSHSSKRHTSWALLLRLAQSVRLDPNQPTPDLSIAWVDRVLSRPTVLGRQTRKELPSSHFRGTVRTSSAFIHSGKNIPPPKCKELHRPHETQ